MEDSDNGILTMVCVKQFDTEIVKINNRLSNCIFIRVRLIVFFEIVKLVNISLS